MSELRRATPGHTTAVEQGTWDGGAAQKNLPSPMPVATANAVYAWLDPTAIDDGEITKAACKLPHHNVSADGTPGAANVAALATAIGVLNGGRGGVDLPDSERTAVYNHLAKHYRDADLEPPELKARPITRAPRSFERRRVPLSRADFRAVKSTADGLPTTFTAVVVRYGVVDDYLTRFRRGVFDDSMENRMPRITWAHDWTNPIGRWTKVVNNDDDGLELEGEFDDFDDVPSARRASAQLRSGTMDQFSVGFYRIDDEEADSKKMPGVYDITRADLVEASPVIEGSVPGTAVTGMRSRPSGLVVPVEEVQRIVVGLSAGTLDVVDALNEARDLATPTDEDPPEPETEDPPPPEGEGETPAPARPDPSAKGAKGDSDVAHLSDSDEEEDEGLEEEPDEPEDPDADDEAEELLRELDAVLTEKVG